LTTSDTLRPLAFNDPSAPGWAAQSLNDAADALSALIRDPESAGRVEAVSKLIAHRFSAGNKVLICGNGGSCCDAMHFAEELTGRFRAERPALPAIACADPGHITCVANDYGFEHVFSRWVSALGQPGDVLVVLSTSGKSANVINAVQVARDRGMHTIALLGKGGGELQGVCGQEWICPGALADRIQELHMLILHMVIEGIERELFPGLYSRGLAP
jgi:D-sedoheptulose 7-phosphate isomerase